MEGENSMRPVLCYTDTGGTFTDTFVVDASGDFVVSKAPSTAEDISKGFFNSVALSAESLGQTMQEFFGQLQVVGYGTTVVINAILNRGGVKTGVITTRGFEHILLMERGRQTYTGYNYTDRLHTLTHRHTNPLVPYEQIRGVTERIDCFGKPIVQLYEQEARQAARELIETDCEAIVILFLFCWLNPEHERRMREIVYEVAREMNREVDVYISFEVSPVTRELNRLNATIVEAYATPFFKSAVGRVEKKVKDYGFRGTLQIMQSTGGLAAADYVKVVETLESGPVGGLIGGQYIGRLYGFDNLITTDVGGTSFDVGLVNKGVITVEREPEVARMLMGVPMAQINSIGAGGGTIARLDPLTGRLQVGPDSAEAVPGPVCYDLGGEQPTVTDTDVILGYIDPEYFLGGSIKLNKEKAQAVMKEKIADPLDLDVVQAAAGVKELIDTKMKDALVGMVMSRGYDISEYYLLGIGGGGPTHLAGYSEGVPLKGVMAFPYSAAFSAFGAASANYEHRYTLATNIVAPYMAGDELKTGLGQAISRAWEDLEQAALVQMDKEGFARDEVSFVHQAMIRYGRQLDDLIVVSPVERIGSPADWDALMRAFEDAYEAIYTKASKFPEAGYEIFEIGLIASVPKIKPVLRRFEVGDSTPPGGSQKGRRQCYFGDQWVETSVYDGHTLTAGNTVEGPSVVEFSTSTLVVPPWRQAYVDEYLTFWLKGGR
jgi:acetone carboxylase beta subunit